MATLAPTLAAIGISAAMGFNARKKANNPPAIPAPPTIPEAPKRADPTRTFADAIAAQKRRTSGVNGRSSTLLTGPLGELGGTTERKTLLGS